MKKNLPSLKLSKYTVNMGSVLRGLIYSISRVQTVIKGKRGVVLVARINLGELNDEITR